MNRRVTQYDARLRFKDGAWQRNRVLNGRLVLCCRPETRRPTHEQVEGAVRRTGGPNPVHVEKCLDDLWIAEKFQSNSEIAGSLRNSFRASVGRRNYGGRALFGWGPISGY